MNGTNVQLNTITPPILHQCIDKITAKIDSSAKAIEVKRSPQPKPIGFCYWNVSAMVESHGGGMVLGWIIHWLPDVYVEAMHHAIWQSADGSLLDITEAYATDQSSPVSVFVPDNRYSISLDSAPCIARPRCPLMVHPTIGKLFASDDRLHALRTEQAEIAYKFGDRCETQKAAARGLPFQPRAVTIDVETKQRWLSIEQSFEREYRIRGKIIAELNNESGLRQ